MRNKRVFDGKRSNISSSKAWIIVSLRESNNFVEGCIQNCQRDLIILHNLGIKGNPPKGPSIIPVSWNLPPLEWIKVNIDGLARGAPGRSGCGRIFRTFRGFVKGCFSVCLGNRFAFEAELFGFMFAIEIAHKFVWNHLWLETDSSYVVILVKGDSYRVPWKFKNIWIRALQYAKNLNFRISHIIVKEIML